MLKTLTLLILTAIVMASVACGPSAPPAPPAPSASELKEVALCEDALERRLEYDKLQYHIQKDRDSSENIRMHNFFELLDAERDIEKYCKDEPPTPVPTPTPNA